MTLEKWDPWQELASLQQESNVAVDQVSLRKIEADYFYGILNIRIIKKV